MTISLVVSIISLSLCVSGFFFLRWYISQRTDASRLLEEYRDEVFRLISEIDGATDRDSRLVEERIKNLRKLLDDTDKRISVYTRELQRSRNSEAIYKNLGRGIREALESIPTDSPVAADSIPAASEKPAFSAEASPKETESPAAPETALPSEVLPSAEIKGVNPSVPHSFGNVHKSAPATSLRSSINELPFNDEEKGRSRSPQAGSEKKQKKRKTANIPSKKKPPEKPGKKMQIAQMALQGLSPSEIATNLGISLAEVDLALKLLKIGTGEDNK